MLNFEVCSAKTFYKWQSKSCEMKTMFKNFFFSNFECLYLPTCMVKLHEIFTTWSQISELQDLIVKS